MRDHIRKGEYSSEVRKYCKNNEAALTEEKNKDVPNSSSCEETKQCQEDVSKQDVVKVFGNSYQKG